jgi:fatty-acyl-CoA synthase
MSENRGTMSSSPPFGYALCAKRLRLTDQDRFDLSSWRIACVGAERINPEPLRQFAHILTPAKFDPKAFVACYGMAECALAISFAPIESEVPTEIVDKEIMVNEGRAERLGPADADPLNSLVFVDCGEVLPSYEMKICDEAGAVVPDRTCGRICLRGPNIMEGYYGDPEATTEALSADGWLDTGDIGYRVGTHLFVTSRRKDVIIVNGRNIWPHDLEYLAEQVPGVRLGNVSAFSVDADAGEGQVVLMVESREKDQRRCREMIQELAGRIRAHFGIDCHVALVPPHTLPRTSSGKLSRFRAKQEFIQRRSLETASEPAA